jgi:hypothetical protein
LLLLFLLLLLLLLLLCIAGLCRSPLHWFAAAAAAAVGCARVGLPVACIAALNWLGTAWLACTCTKSADCCNHSTLCDILQSTVCLPQTPAMLLLLLLLPPLLVGPPV